MKNEWTSEEKQFLVDACVGLFGEVRHKHLCALMPRHSPCSVSTKMVELRLSVKSSRSPRVVESKTAGNLRRLRRAVEMQSRVFL